MAEAMLALLRTLGSLRSGKVWLYVLAPALLSFVLWVGLAVWGLGRLVELLLDQPPMTLLVSWGVVWLAHLLAWLGGWMAIFALAYLTASLLAAVLVLPLLLKHLAATEYRDVAAMGADNLAASTVNSLWAAFLFLLGWLLTVPLWLIPGFSLLLPLLLMGWFNRKTFLYDALSMHATDAEWATLKRSGGGQGFMLGLTMALLAHVPLLGLFAPALAALAYVHFGLEGLRRLRGEAVVTGEAVRVVE